MKRDIRMMMTGHRKPRHTVTIAGQFVGDASSRSDARRMRADYDCGWN